MAETKSSKSNLYKALAELQKTPILPKKSAKGVHGHNYATLEDTWDACREILNKNNLIVVQRVVDNVLYTKLIHSPSGESINSIVSLENAKGDMQGLGSAITYARRYALTTLIGAIPEDDDGQSASDNTVQYTYGNHEPVTATFKANTSATDKLPPSEKQKKFVSDLLTQKVPPSDRNEFLMGEIGDIEPKTMSDAKKLIDTLMEMPNL